MSEFVEAQRLLDAAIKGDRSCLGQLLDRFRPRIRESVHSRIRGPLLRRIDESDVIQQACLRALHAFDEQFRGQSVEEFWAWLDQIQRHTFVDLVRNHQAGRRDARQHQSDADPDQLIGENVSHGHSLILAEREHKIQRALEKLPETQREAVRLRHLEGRKIEDVAKCLGKSPGAAAQIIYRGIATLKKLLEADHS